MEQELKKIDSSDQWVQFSQAYLAFAHLACKEVLRPSHKRIGTLKYRANDIFIPIIYNIKHGIEMFIKSLLKIILAEKFNENDFKHHNIRRLFEVLKIEIKKHDIARVIKEQYEADKSNIDLKIAYDNVSKIDEFLANLDELINKYFRCEILQDKIKKNFIIEDMGNIVFRYPDNNLKIKIDYQQVVNEISDSDIKVIIDDIDKLLENFNILGFIFEVYKESSKKKQYVTD